MKMIKAEDIKRFDNWTCLVYSEPGKGKTTMVKSLKGKTILLSVDGMYHVLAQQDNVIIQVMDSDNPNKDLGDFYRFLVKHKDQYDNIVIDNLSTFQKYWLNERSTSTTSGMPEIKDYGVIDRILFDFIASLKQLEKNVLIFAHEKKVEITRESGGTYTQFQPDVRNLDAIMGIVPIVGRLVVVKDEENHKNKRIVVLQPTQSTRAKDQLIGNLQTIDQMELLPTLQK
ncbi:MAG TPA: AAA family ATPase [Candidatus Enterococcus avicola]|uniref:AAA family ATPase n=1 Tax=Candidatus Enterococcus avicola TaxID=2838561 RepID=A0A9D2JIV5_9ENTE|nr:AAA family ATPase [Candidatus Enterococcus avicola]